MQSPTPSPIEAVLRSTFRWSGLLVVLLSCVVGCQPIQPYYLNEDGDLSHYLDVATQIEYPDVQDCTLPDVTQSRVPITILDPSFDAYWDLSLEEAISIALQNSKVIPTLGGVRQLGQAFANPPTRVSTSPDAVTTIYDVGIFESGQNGVEQALANFDAVFRSTTTWDSSDRAQNFRTGQIVNPPELQADQVNINNEISKLTAGGAQWFFRNVSIYDGTNNDLTAQTRALPSSWFTALEAEVRQPLLRGRGTQLNRLPVVLARIRTDIALTDFQEGIETLLAEVEQAYWELYFSYRNLEAARTGRDSALSAWQRVKALKEEPTGSRDREAQAREQYFSFDVALKEAYRRLQITETRLRFLMGIAATDGRFIRPCDEPTLAKVEFDWHTIQCEALSLSNELRRLRWRVKQSELQLIAAKNQLLPQVDAVALYRWLGVGDEFDSFSRRPQDFPEEGSTAVDSLFQGKFQEYRLGLSAEINLGFRRELAQVRAQQLVLARERARLQTAELEVMHQLTDAYQNLVANLELIQGNMNRRIAAATQVEAAEIGQEQGNVELFNLLDAQRRRADADVSYYQSVVDYNLALLNLHRVKGTLLAYNNVMLHEGPWPEKAYFDAQNLARQRDASYYFDYGYSRPRVFSRGPLDLNRGSGTAASLADDQTFEMDSETGVETIVPQESQVPQEVPQESKVAPEMQLWDDLTPPENSPQLPGPNAEPLPSNRDWQGDSWREGRAPRPFRRSADVAPPPVHKRNDRYSHTTGASRVSFVEREEEPLEPIPMPSRPRARQESPRLRRPPISLKWKDT